MKRTQKFPIIPSKEDVTALLDATKNLKHKAILVLIYGSSLRVSEVAKLKIFYHPCLRRWVDSVFIQQMLGHKRLQTTLSYLHMTSKSLMGIKSPLDTPGGHKV